MRGRLVPLCLLLAVLGCGGAEQEESGSTSPGRETESFGRFEGEVVGVWDPNGRDMTLREDFVYVDPRQRRWKAPSGSVVNGASIPRVFWSAIGGPFEGRYRSASVVHDVACVEMTEPWEDVHRMFYEACRCGGVGEKKAKLIYWAVQRFGPRWKTVHKVSPDSGTTVQVSERIAPPPPPANIAAVAKEFFETNTPTLEEVETLTVAEIQEAVQEVEPPQELAPDGMESEQPEQPEAPDATDRQGDQAPEVEAPEAATPEAAAPEAAAPEAATPEAAAPEAAAPETAAPESLPSQDLGPASGESQEPAGAEPRDPEK